MSAPGAATGNGGLPARPPARTALPGITAGAPAEIVRRRPPFSAGTAYVPSEPKLPDTLSKLKPIPVGILESRDGAPWELEDLGWLERRSMRLERLEHHPDIFDLDGVNRGTQVGPRGCAWPQNEFEVLPFTPTVRNRGPAGVGESIRFSRPMTFV